MTSLSIQDRVRRGASLLDDKFPGWADSVNVATLNLESACQCILGQRFGDFLDGAERVGLSMGSESYALRSRRQTPLHDHGFMVIVERSDYESDVLRISRAGIERIEAEYVALTESWKKLIVDRRAEAQLAEVQEPALVETGSV